MTVALAYPVVLPAGIHVFERGWLSSNNVLMTSQHSSVLIDSGYHSHGSQTVELVRSVLGDRPLEHLINTHLHSDHCGGNAALTRQYSQLRVSIPPGQADMVSSWNSKGLSYEPTGQFCPAFEYSDLLIPGSTLLLGLLEWEIHAAKGHDPHSVILFQPNHRLVISADALWENGFGVVFPELDGADAFDDVGATLDLIEALNPNIVIPGHGRVFAYSPDVIELARARLQAFVTNPARHAHYAAKVLLKFRLLEKQRLMQADLAAWAKSTPLVRQIHHRFFSEEPIANWIDMLIKELIATKKAQVEGGHILNA